VEGGGLWHICRISQECDLGNASACQRIWVLWTATACAHGGQLNRFTTSRVLTDFWDPLLGHYSLFWRQGADNCTQPPLVPMHAPLFHTWGLEMKDQSVCWEGVEGKAGAWRRWGSCVTSSGREILQLGSLVVVGGRGTFAACPGGRSCRSRERWKALLTLITPSTNTRLSVFLSSVFTPRGRISWR
jgi:hypothetical protein